jgi:hypothetical protein
MKKFLALLMAALMLLSCGSAMAEYDKHIEFTTTNRGILTAGVDYTGDAFYEWLCEKFNVSIEPIITDSATHEATTTMWINNGDMCDVLTQSNFSYSTYLDWIDQGLIAPLPDGWEEKYPNLYNAMQKSMVLEKLTVDGKVYTIPAPVYENFIDVDIPIAHQCIYYRKDWAEQLGYNFGDTITVSQLKEFCLKAIEQNLAGNGATVGLTTRTSSIINDLMCLLGFSYTKYVKTEEGYVWGPAMEGVTNQIAVIRDLYASGMLDPDFYLLDGDSCYNRFASGVAAALYHDGGPGNHATVWSRFSDANPDKNVDDCVDSVVLTDDNGICHPAECTNFWTVKYFSPDIDPEVFDRILCMIDYFNSREGEVAAYYGIPEVDWVWTEEGLFDASVRDAEKPKDFSKDLVCTWGTCSDELYAFNAANEYPKSVESYLTNMDIKANGDVIRYDYDYWGYASEAKSQYSVDMRSKVVELVVDSTLDIEAEWAKFIADNEGMWKPLLDELNATFCAK